MKRDTINGLEELDNLPGVSDLSDTVWSEISNLFDSIRAGGELPTQAGFVVSCVEFVLNSSADRTDAFWLRRISQMLDFWGVWDGFEQGGVSVGVLFGEYLDRISRNLSNTVRVNFVASSKLKQGNRWSSVTTPKRLKDWELKRKKHK